ncbi:hypothetical protein GGI25_001411 [Coemansia spiralis]|uniref:pH-response regulator protein palC n=2 Tax=Coemansia TaxID=4863 RepID=A0A9W8G615_9FUNG|nr:hypothetical protein BX070DRAFT_249893 [Coemansia spiralis]KAJ1994754.1 hypothetical protein EDC05_001376 [Coemansia umbellata]KAJ2624544.1 hypothetical protein GGI26_001463 [Coemansia sp. RSA 1358]KAJ2679488.1 hypothetical protein GGI25_001411 [Coemansia spiralis]
MTPYKQQKSVKYYLRNPKTKIVTAPSLLPASLQNDTELYGRVSKLCMLREAVRERLKAQSKTEDLSRIGTVISAIETYLGELHWYISFYEDNREAFKELRGVEFIWKSAIVSRMYEGVNLTRPRFGFRSGNAGDSDGGNNGASGGNSGNAAANSSAGTSSAASRMIARSFKQRRTQSPSIYVELGFTLLSLAVTKSMSAYSKVSSLDTEIECETINAMTPGTQAVLDEEGEQGVEALKRASVELREAAGVFQYIIDHVLPQISTIRLGVPDLTPDIQYMLQMLSLADSDRLSVRVWLRTDKNQRKTPNIPANLLLGIQERYLNASSLVRTLQNGEFRSVSSDIQNYMRDGQIVILAQAMIYLAQVHSDNQKYGNAVGFMRDARELLNDVKKRNQSVHAKTAEMLLRGPIEPLYSLYRRNNDTIGFEQVPSSEDLRARLPSGRALISRALQYSPASIPSSGT